MAKSKRLENGRKILDEFKAFYKDKNGRNFDVNYSMIVMCEKLSDHYEFKEMSEAMEYYFRYHEGDFFEFVGNIDTYLRNRREEQEAKKHFEDLIKQTQKEIAKINKMKVGDE